MFQPARKMAKTIPEFIRWDIRQDVNVSERWLKSNNVVNGFTRKRGNTGVSVIVVINSRVIPMTELRPQYSPGREAGLGSAYGRGTGYTLYRGERQRVGHVFLRPSAVNPDLTPSPGFRIGPDDYITRVSDDTERFPIRRWRSLNVANYYRNPRGERELPDTKRAIVKEVQHRVKIASQRVFGRGQLIR